MLSEQKCLALFGVGGLATLFVEWATPEKISPVVIFIVSGLLASSAGIGELLASERPFNARNIASAVFNCGLLGVGVSMVWHSYFAGKGMLFILMGTCLFIGYGGLPITVAARKNLGKWIGKYIGGNNDPG